MSIKEKEAHFTYPEQGGVKTIGVGETVLDFFKGVARSPKGEESDISDSLDKRELNHCRSILIHTTQDLEISLDSRTGQRGGKFTIDANKYTRIFHQKFNMVYLTAAASTDIKVWASTHPEGIPSVNSKEFILLSVVTLTWTNVTTTNAEPDTDTAIDVSLAESIYVQADSTDDDNTSTDTDINVISSPDGITFDDGVDGIFAAMNIGDDDVKSMLVNTGPKEIKLRLDENGALRADVTAIVVVRKG